MLVVSRKDGQQIRIGDDIVITVVRTGQHSTRIGIDAPREIPIVRSELGPKADVAAVREVA